MAKMPTVYRVGSLHLSEGVTFNPKLSIYVLKMRKKIFFFIVKQYTLSLLEILITIIFITCRCMEQAKSQFLSLEGPLLIWEKHTKMAR